MLLEKFLAENKCCPTLSDGLIPEVIAWVDKNTKINVSAHQSATVKVLKHLAGGAHSGHSPSHGRRRGLVAGRGSPGRVQGALGGQELVDSHSAEEAGPLVTARKNTDGARANGCPDVAQG